MRHIIIPLFMLLLNQPSALGQWQPCYNGLASTVYCFGDKGNLIYAGAHDRILVSYDTCHWATLQGTGIPSSESILSMTSNATHIFLGTDSTIYSGPVLASGTITSGPGGQSTYSFAVVGQSVFAATIGAGVLRTNDNGLNWTPMNSGLPTSALYSIIEHNGKLFAGTVGHGIYVSTDLGTTWTAANNGIPSNAVVRCLASDGTNLLAGTRWFMNPDVNASGMYRSTDGGSSWSQVTFGISTTASVFNISLVDGVLLAASEGIKRSLDGGESWYSWMDGFPQGASLAVSDFHVFWDKVFVSLEGWTAGRIYERNRADLQLGLSSLGSEKCGFGIHPNPATDRVTVEVQNGHMAGVSIIDATGRNVVTTTLNAKANRTELDIAHLAPGIYTVVLETQAGPAVARLVRE